MTSKGTLKDWPRKDWRDPNMSVLRNYIMGNGKTITEVDPDYESRYRTHLMSTAAQPSYRDDPTYNLKRKT